MHLKNLVVFSVIAMLLGTTGLVSSQAVAAENTKQIVTVNIQEVLLGSEAGQGVKKVLEENLDILFFTAFNNLVYL